MSSSLQFAQDITSQVNTLWESGQYLEQATITTRNLLTYWFDERYQSLRDRSFHVGQKQAILNTIYVHEVLKCKNIFAAYEHFSPDLLIETGLNELSRDKYAHPKYCIKMATGTGKTWVLQALLVWQYLNAKYEEGNFSKNFLLVAPGLIVYERLLDAFLGKEKETIVQTSMTENKTIERTRDFETSDIYQNQELFLPQEYRTEVFGFFQSCVVEKEDIGSKVTGEGVIAMTNWHLLVKEDQEKVKNNFLPLRPGSNAGNDLSTLDNQFGKDRELYFLRDLKDLVIFNDEAHHIHEIKKKGEVEEVEWQKSLNFIAGPKKERCVQIDFSATPYNQLAGENRYFPHIIVDFELKTAILSGLVKTVVLDQRKEIATLPLEYNATRDENGKVIGLSEGQRKMLRAGIAKLRILEKAFEEISITKNKYPKMLVACEDTEVAPLITEFLRGEGLSEDDILEVHSNKKGEVSEEEWKQLKSKLFHLDQHSTPKVVVSVLMLREGFDVNNICVIVPLRSTQSKILLEQTIGRGLRLMWREPEFEAEKKENLKRILQKQEPKSQFDILSIIEHPAFSQFYKEFIEAGMVGFDSQDVDTMTRENITGSMITVGLRSDYEQFDFHFPLIVRESEKVLKDTKLNIEQLEPIRAFSFAQLKKMIPKGDVFVSEELIKGTRFGDYSVLGGMMTATSYNDYISRLVNRIATLVSEPLSGRHERNKTRYPALQVKMPLVAELADTYIRNRLFQQSFSPFEDENWRMLLIDYVSEHIIKEIAKAILSMQETESVSEPEVFLRALSEVQSLYMREEFSLQTSRTIYGSTPFPQNKGGFEKSFIEYADTDSSVLAFIKLIPHTHYFVRLRYIKEDGLSAYYYPDFLVRCKNSTIYMVETKAQDQLSHPNVKRKQIAALTWIERVNKLPVHLRDNALWEYVLLGEEEFYSFKNKLASVQEILEFAKLRESNMTGRLL